MAMFYERKNTVNIFLHIADERKKEIFNGIRKATQMPFFIIKCMRNNQQNLCFLDASCNSEFNCTRAFNTNFPIIDVLFQMATVSPLEIRVSPDGIEFIAISIPESSHLVLKMVRDKELLFGS